MRTKDTTMTKRLLATLAVSLSSIAGSALAADMPITAPWSTPVPVFSWTSCYFGAHVGGGMSHKDINDPVQLAQDSIIGPGTTVGVTTVSPSPSGAVFGGQIGCDYQFASNWVIGVEGAATGSNMTGSTTVGLPAGFAGDQALVGANVDFLSSVTARLGFAVDRLLFYGKGGVAWVGDKYTVTGTLVGGGFGFEGLDVRTGWTAGAGVEWAFARNWSVSVEYDYYSFGNGTILMSDTINGFSGPVDVKQSVQVVKAGLNFHMWSGW
jgi:outer membrane immunogenic protein